MSLLTSLIIPSLTGGGLTKDILQAVIPQFVPVLEATGARLFPKLAPEFHAVAAATTAYDPDFTKWLQGTLNLFLADPKYILVVDGQYGAATVLAVQAAQVKLGLEDDGWAGKITDAALRIAVVALPVILKVA